MGIRPRRLRMSDQSHIPPKHARSSRERYRRFVRDYKARRLDDLTDPNTGQKRLDEPAAAGGEVTASKPALLGGNRRQYLREYLRWLWPHRYGVGVALPARADRHGTADDRAAVHAVHHRPRPPEYRARHRRPV